MNSPIGVTNICATNRKQTASFKIVSLLLAITPLWLMLAAANASAHAQTTSSSADWTQFLRDNMQRWNPYETVLGVNNVDGLKLKWTFTKVQPNISGEAGASPVVANGVVYIGSPDNEAIVYALDASTGEKLWSYQAHVGITDSVAVANGIVYAGSANGLYALNASTGALLWIYVADGEIVSSPAVANGVVYVGTQLTNTFAGTVYALNASTGAKLWSYTTEGPVSSSAAVANGVVYIGDGGLTVPSGMDGQGHLYALNASTGAKLWSYTAEGPAISSAGVANGVVYIGDWDFSSGVGMGSVYALNASTGAKLWSFTSGGNIISSPAVANGVVYVGAYDGNVYALNASTGAELWSYTTAPTGGPLGTNPVGSSPAVANGVVYVEGEGATLYALNAATGAKLWSYSPGPIINPANSSPAVVDGMVYAVSYGSVLAFGLETPGTADLYLRVQPSATTVHQGDLLTFAFPVWNLGPDVAEGEVLSNLQVPAGTTFDYVRISGTPGLGTCTHPPYGGTGQIICHEGDGMAPNTTWTVRLTVKVTAAAGSTITANAATMADTPDPNLGNNTATVSIKVQ